MEIFIPGPQGRLEAIVTTPEGQEQRGVVIVCHPHPLHQGTMHNKVVTTLVRAMDKQHFVTLRFNYRGVGESEGTYGEIQGEVADLEAVKSWVMQAFPELSIWLAGFSFGAFIAASVANRCPEVEGLITVAPAVHHADFSSLTCIRCPWLVLQGVQDEIVPYTDVVDFVKHSSLSPRLWTIETAGHFFHGCLGILQEKVMAWVTEVTAAN